MGEGAVKRALGAGARRHQGDLEALASGPRTEMELPPFWITEGEVREEEYIDFASDPETRRQIVESGGTIRVPREAGERAEPPTWEDLWRPDEARYALPKWHMHPMRGISQEDAYEYARWREKRAAVAGFSNQMVWSSGMSPRSTARFITRTTIAQ